MAKELLVNVSRGEEVRVALVEDGRLEEIYLERDSAASNVGNIYLGKVTNVEGSIQAAFVDFGYGRNGFLHVQDLHPDHFPDGGRWDRMTERVGKKIGRRDRPPIQDCLRRGDQIVVQIIKEGIGTKGPTLTSYPSIPGRFLVMMPGVEQMGVSKNIEDEEERRRLRKVLDGLKPPEHVGFIIRTAGMGKTKAELERDFKYLTRLHEQIEHHKKNARPPTLLYSEGDLVTRTVRDVWSGDVDRVVCDDPETALRIKQFFRLLMPRTKVNVQLYQGHVPLFHAAGVEAEIETMFSRHVPLPSGGSLVIDSTEAVVAIDVNSGKFREHDDAEETAFRTDMEAAEEICRQLRLRDLGGVVICDFIDLRYSRHREALFNKLTDLFKQDKAKSRHLPMNEFGIVAITRQRMRPDLKKSVFMPCPWSHGTGVIKTPESMALDVMRRLRVAAADDRVREVSVRLYPTVALHVLNAKRQALADLERQSGRIVTLTQDDTLAADDVILELVDERGGQVAIDSLRPAAVEQTDQGGRRRRRRRRRGDEEKDSTKAGTAAAGAASGLIPLPDLLELGELKLEEVEKLVDEVVAGETAVREAATKDPQTIIMDALRSGALYDDEATDGELEESAGQRQPQAEGEPEKGGRGRRRRRRGRDRHDEQPTAESPRTPTPVAEPEGGFEDEAADAFAAAVATPDEQPRQERRPQEAHGVNGEPEGREGGRRRRRRRRGRRGDEERTHAGENGEAPRGPARPAVPDDALDRELNGNRIDAETHTRRRDPFEGTPLAGEREHGRRGRRRRKGRGLRGHAVETDPQRDGSGRPKPAGMTDEQLDARLNGNRIEARGPKPIGVYRESDDDDVMPHLPVEPVPAPAPSSAPQGESAETGGRRRRRRRRRRGGRGQEGAPVTSPVQEVEVSLGRLEPSDPVEMVALDDEAEILLPGETGSLVELDDEGPTVDLDVIEVEEQLNDPAETVRESEAEAVGAEATESAPARKRTRRRAPPKEAKTAKKTPSARGAKKAKKATRKAPPRK